MGVKYKPVFEEFTQHQVNNKYIHTGINNFNYKY